MAKNRRPIDKAFIHSVFDRDHPDTAERKVIEAFADAVVALDNSVPTGTYVDMCSRLPVVNPEKITVPTLIMRGQYDGIASMDDLLEFFAKLPNPDKQFTVMPGISHASFQQKNYMMVYHILASFFSQPEPVYRRADRERSRMCGRARPPDKPGIDGFRFGMPRSARGTTRFTPSLSARSPNPSPQIDRHGRRASRRCRGRARPAARCGRCASRSAAAAARSLLCAATIMHCAGGRSNASQAAR